MILKAGRRTLAFIAGAFAVSCAHYAGRTAFYQSHFAPDQPGESSLNKTIRDLSFFPLNGPRFRLSELKDFKAIVIVMREKDCPISEKYGPRLVRLEEKYSKQGVQFIYNYVGQVRREQSAREDLKRFGFKGPYGIDSKQTVINALLARTTGDLFILTPERRVVYRGPVDDQHHLLRSALKARNNYVDDILQDIVSGKAAAPKQLPAPGCVISRPALPNKVFYKDAAPIIRAKCSSCHHPSGWGAPDYIGYEDVAGRGAMFKYVIENDLMPPWHLDPNTGPWQNDISLTVREKALLLRWANQGFPKRQKGENPLWAKKPEKPKASADYIIPLPETVTVPAEGPFDYKRFVVQTNFKENKWIKNAEFIKKPKVIHHYIIYVMDPSFDTSGDLSKKNYHSQAVSFIEADDADDIKYNPQKLHPQAGVRLPRGAKLIADIHYEPIGREIVDDFTHVLINFYKNPPKYEVVTYTLQALPISVAPYESNHKAKISYKMDKSLWLAQVQPHMHLRGKASSIYVIDPKGERRRIFGIDPFIQNFESSYNFENPIKISKGSILECVNWFDNSAENPVNPAPEKYVRDGYRTEDEMSICFFKFLAPVNENHKFYEHFYIKPEPS